MTLVNSDLRQGFSSEIEASFTGLTTINEDEISKVLEGIFWDVQAKGRIVIKEVEITNYTTIATVKNTIMYGVLDNILTNDRYRDWRISFNFTGSRLYTMFDEEFLYNSIISVHKITNSLYKVKMMFYNTETKVKFTETYPELFI